MRVSLLIFALLVASHPFRTEAADAEFEVRGAVRCPCPASLIVGNSQYEGPTYVDNDQKVKSITAEVKGADGKTRTLVLKNPKEGIRNYYAGDTLKKELEAAGHSFKAGDDVYLDKFTADADIPLYTDAGPSFGDLSNVPKAKKKGAGGGGADKFQCSYVTPPNLLSTEGCGKTKICAATVDCEGIGETIVSCLATGDTCPDASKCADDPAVGVKRAENARDYADEIHTNKQKKENAHAK